MACFPMPVPFALRQSDEGCQLGRVIAVGKEGAHLRTGCELRILHRQFVIYITRKATKGIERPLSGQALRFGKGTADLPESRVSSPIASPFSCKPRAVSRAVTIFKHCRTKSGSASH